MALARRIEFKRDLLKGIVVEIIVLESIFIALYCTLILSLINSFKPLFRP